MSLLEVNGLVVRYGDFQALHGVSLRVEEGSTVSLIGANGAGKTTLIHTVCGVHRPALGAVRFLGEDVTGRRTSRIVARGLTCAPEGSRCFEKMTVRDNLLMGAYLCRTPAERRRRLEDIFALFPALAEKQNQLATFLSGGQRQMLAIGRAIMTEPRLLICDEISLGLAPVVIKDIYAKLREIAQRGITLLIVDQDVNRSLRHSDYAYVMLEGRLVMEGASHTLDADEVNDAYFGINRYAG